jgi:hypothetical protein
MVCDKLFRPCRGRFIAPSADLSALAAYPDVRILLVNVHKSALDQTDRIQGVFAPALIR